MSSNQQILLNTLLEQQKNEHDPDLKDDEYFEIFVTEQILKNYELSYDEIIEGIVDNGGDGGIDGIFTFVNSELIQRDSDLIDGKRNSVIDVFLIQSKNTSGFTETAVEKCVSSASDIFDLTKTIDSLRTVYNNDLLINVEIFRNQYLHLASKFPVIKFHYFYAAKATEVHPNVERKIENLKATIRGLFDKADVNFDFLTAQSLIDLSRREQIRTKDIALTDNPISTQDGGYVAIVPLKNYFDFITDDDDNLIKYFFDANIRDYQGNVEVNSAIRDTLSSKLKEDFWWLNNGITITATNASFASKKLHIEDPQIVNGLQSSFEIYNYYHDNKIENDQRSVLVRIVKTNEEQSRLKVIKATNSQTSVPPASLRATDPIHRDIEDYLFAHSYYYDRRKNYHKNQGRPINKIISIPFLAQIVMSILHQKPDYARARPSTLIKVNADYESIFSTQIPIELYFKCISLHKKVEDHLKNYANPTLSRTQIGDIKFHVSMYAALRIVARLKPKTSELSGLNLELLTTDILDEATECVYIVYDAMGGNNSVAKGKEFVKEVTEQLTEKIEENE
ncbi:AIPR family protein [Fulvivirga lutea]|uniref:AIPR family protein n=1 Tax=Fulvivirga lutea TaxID=2810512 RepID=A0A974WEI7_9BACT|nr:AIPR family protein [Fulvivirga lutea]QSE96914.1 AIPR family protein [Fulvivirga lutea]